MPHATPEGELATPDQLLRLFRVRPRVGCKKKLRQIDMAALVGIETRTLQLWECGERLPSPDNLQRLIGALLAERLLLPGEEEQEAQLLWKTVAQAYEERPGTYRLYPPFDERWFRRLLHDATHMLTAEQGLHQEVQAEKRGEHTGSGVPYTPTNLRPHPTSFLGRGPDLAEIKQLLVHTHFVTLTGAGGCGKTRLAQQVGEDMLDQYTDGVWLVELATLTDAALLPGLIATTLALAEQPRHTLLETLVAVLQHKRMLLILDNCEHLVEACASIAEHLHASCPELSLLITSREALNADDETVWQVAPLAVPARSLQSVTAAQIRHTEAVQLFLARARLLLPHFELTDQNAPTIASICQRLDGIPLALELAAARMNLLSLEQLAERLEDRFHLLTAGRRTALPRHQTLRATLDWSYESLSQKEQQLFRRLSVFAGEWTLEAIETICVWPAMETESVGMTIEPREVLDLLAKLVNKSLVLTVSTAQEAGPHAFRYRLLETMKRYGQEQLEEWRGKSTQEQLLLQKHHARYYMELVEQADRHLRSGARETWLVRLRAAQENLRAALAWSLSLQGELEVGMRIAGMLYWFWLHEGIWSEGRSWLEKLLAQAPRYAEHVPLARAVHGLSVLVWVQGERQQAEHLAREAAALALRSGDDCLFATALRLLVQVELSQGNQKTARKFAEESVRLAREQGDHWNLASSLSVLGTVLQAQEEYLQAEQIYQESLHGFEETGDRWEQTGPLRSLGHLAWMQGKYEQAAHFYTRSIALCQGMRGTWLLTRGLEGLARVVCAQGNFPRAVALLAAAEEQRSALGAVVLPTMRADYNHMLSVLRTSLSSQAFEEAWRFGSSMSAEQSMAYALGDDAISLHGRRLSEDSGEHAHE
ncbi:ATP-binding protein [Ktedonosporobacter rubrisoli]|nr:tetratricopeptide repeat protein [Ktedonosporobacter rubrisoli]